MVRLARLSKTSRSRKGAWIEIRDVLEHIRQLAGRSRKGAWIEIALSANYNLGEGVAPVRERGLKYQVSQMLSRLLSGRSRKGAWIEISTCV